VSLRIPSSSRSPDHDPPPHNQLRWVPLGRFADLKYRQLARQVGVIITTGRIRRTSSTTFNLLGDSIGLIYYTLLVELYSGLRTLPLWLLTDCTSTNSRISNSSSFYIQVLYGIKTRSFFRYGFQVVSLQAVHARDDQIHPVVRWRSSSRRRHRVQSCPESHSSPKLFNSLCSCWCCSQRARRNRSGVRNLFPPTP
jgi:hypothetical protein